jgi:NHL repeat-containing protein
VFDRVLTARTGAATMVAVALTTALAIGFGEVARQATAAEVSQAKGLAPGTITTIGGGVGGPGPGTSVSVGDPCALTYSGGILYAGDQGGVLPGGVVRAISVRTGHLSTPIGTGFEGFTRDGGLGTGNSGWDCGLAVDRWHNLVFSDGDEYVASFNQSTGNDRVRVLAASNGTFYGQRMRAGRVYTIAGTGVAGHVGDGGKAIHARLNDPAGLAIDQHGNVIVADDVNNRVRVIAQANGSFYGVQMHKGDIYTVAGDGNFGTTGLGGPAVEAELKLRVGEPHGGVTTPSSGIRVDHQGNLVIADPSAGLVLVLAAHSGTFYGQEMTAGDLYSIAGGGTAVGDGGLATKASLIQPAGLAIDHRGNVLISAGYLAPIRVVAAVTGRFYGMAMTAGHLYSLPFTSSLGVSVDGAGNVVAAGGAHEGAIRVLATTTGSFYGQHMKAGHSYLIAGISQLQETDPSGVATRTSLKTPVFDSTVDHSGNLLLVNQGSVFLLAGHTGPDYGRQRVRGHFYTIASCHLDKIAAAGVYRPCDLGPTDNLFPQSIAVDPNGNLIITQLLDNGLWVVAMHTGKFYGRQMKAGTIYRAAGGGKSTASGIPAGQANISALWTAVDRAGNVIESDGNLVRVITTRAGRFFGREMKAGYAYTLAGGGTSAGDGVPGQDAKLQPAQIRVDQAGNVVVLDQQRNLVRVIADRTGTFYRRPMIAGDIYTIAGGGTTTSNGVPARSALLHPAGLAIDVNGNVIVSDSRLRLSGACCFYTRSVVRLIATTTGDFYGQHMIGGRIYTIAGRGPVGYSGDGGPGPKALLNDARGVSYWPGHGVVISDGIRIRLVTP